MAPVDTNAIIKRISEPPPPGSPYGVPVPNTERPGRSAIYRHWRFRDQPLLVTFDPEVQSLHDIFEETVRKFPNNRCLGARNWIPASRSWEDKFDWLTYTQVAQRRKNFGAGIVEIHNAIGHSKDKYGVGLWSQNRPEWQITGRQQVYKKRYLDTMLIDIQISLCPPNRSSPSPFMKHWAPTPPSTSSTMPSSLASLPPSTTSLCCSSWPHASPTSR